MPKNCPLCGAPREEGKLFCKSCAQKIEHEYEVQLPQSATKNKKQLAVKDKALDRAQEKQAQEQTPGSKQDTGQVNSEKANSKRSKSKRKWYLSGVAIVAGLVLVFGFVLYGMWVRQNNLDKLKWDAAVKQQTVQGYIDYMVAFPKGKYYDAAEGGVRIIKDIEEGGWHELQLSDNSAALRDYLNSYEKSAYRPLVQRRLDSLEWSSALSDNSLESYRRYMHMVTRGDFTGEFVSDAEERAEMLTQVQRVDATILEQLKESADGFFTALSVPDADKLEQYLAEEVFRFFGPGGKREKIVGELLISGSKQQSPTIDFIPDLSGLVYEKTHIEHYLVNLPVQKRTVNTEGVEETLTGYIVCMELNQQLQILTITEKKPRRR